MPPACPAVRGVRRRLVQSSVASCTRCIKGAPTRAWPQKREHKITTLLQGNMLNKPKLQRALPLHSQLLWSDRRLGNLENRSRAMNGGGGPAALVAMTRSHDLRKYTAYPRSSMVLTMATLAPSIFF